MGLDHIKELMFARHSSRLVLVVSDLVSDLEGLIVYAVGLTGPNLCQGLMVLLVGASPNRSCTSVLCQVVTAGTVPKHVSKLGGKKVEIACLFDVSSFFSTPVSKSSTSTSSKTRLVLRCYQSGCRQ